MSCTASQGPEDRLLPIMVDIGTLRYVVTNVQAARDSLRVRAGGALTFTLQAFTQLRRRGDLTAAFSVLDFTYYLIRFSNMETMRTTEPISVTLPPEMLKRARKLAARENRTMSELVREALRRYEQGAQAPVVREQALIEFQ